VVSVFTYICRLPHHRQIYTAHATSLGQIFMRPGPRQPKHDVGSSVMWQTNEHKLSSSISHTDELTFLTNLLEFHVVLGIGFLPFSSYLTTIMGPTSSFSLLSQVPSLYYSRARTLYAHSARHRHRMMETCRHCTQIYLLGPLVCGSGMTWRHCNLDMVVGAPAERSRARHVDA
jgi:hypothetical protein